MLGGILDVDLAIGERGKGEASQVVAEGATPVLKVSVAAPPNDHIRRGIDGGEVRLRHTLAARSLEERANERTLKAMSPGFISRPAPIDSKAPRPR